jgi:Flp pilus assembly protein TadG
MKPIHNNWLCSWRRLRRSARAMLRDRSGVAAIEFAFIAPIMLVAFFGTVEFCSAIAIDRKVTLIARTVSDLTSQAAASQATGSVNSTYLQNVFTASISIIGPYAATPVKTQVSEIYVDSNGKATIQWSQAAIISSNSATQATLSASSRSAGDVVTSVVPAALLVHQTYLIFSEVSYLYVPVVGYVMAKTGINMSDVSYTRPRQSTCIVYNNLPLLVAGQCPQS